MPIVKVTQLKDHVGQSVTLAGWLYNSRVSSKVVFLVVRDGSGSVQCVTPKAVVGEALFAELDSLPQESSLQVDGEVKAEPRSPGGHELHVRAVQIVGRAEPFPITNKEHSTGFLMEHRHLWLRSSRQAATLRVRARVIKSIRDFFDSRDFTCLDAPIFTPSACEGTSTLFEVDYFGDKAYLTQSGQLYGEAGAMALGSIYVFGPTFRAEKSKTRRHLTEFWMVEPEMAFADLDDDMDLAEDFLVHVVRRVLEGCAAELATLERDTTALRSVQKPFPRIRYDEAIATLQKQGFAIEWGADLGAEEETALSASFDRPVMVHRYPAASKAFYMKGDPADPRLALCVDVLAPEGYGEIIGGGQREDDADVLEAKIAAHGLPRESFAWYLDLRRYGSVPHAGFGMGIERAVAWLCGLRHVRETIPFPRMLERLRP